MSTVQLIVSALLALAALWMLWSMYSTTTRSLQMENRETRMLLERAMNLLKAESPEEFLRMQTSKTTPSTSPQKPTRQYPSPEPDPLEGPEQSAYEQAITEGVDDDIAQYIE